MKNILHEFKAFILKGNVLDLAVGVIIGAAFGKIVESMVGHIIMPFVDLIGSVFRGQPDFSKIMIGNFLGAILNFLLLAAVVFFCIVKPASKLMAAMKKEEAAAPPPTPADIALLTEIRDLLKK